MLFNDYIYEVYKNQSFTKAADKLFISQPALSSAIKKVELKIGHELFDRSSNPVKLTEEGKIYIKAIEEINIIKSNLSDKLNDISNLKVGKIQIGGANFISSYVIPEIIINFSKPYPGISIDLYESNSRDLQLKLLDENIDLLIDYAFDDNKFQSYPLLLENILIAVPSSFQINNELKDYALNFEDIENTKHLTDNCASVFVNKFKKEKFISLKKGNDMYVHAHKIFMESNIVPKIVMYLDQLMTSYKFTQAGMGISFVTDTLVKSVGIKENVVFYKLKSQYSLRTIYISHKKGKYIKKAVTAFVDTARNLYSK